MINIWHNKQPSETPIPPLWKNRVLGCVLKSEIAGCDRCRRFRLNGHVKLLLVSLTYSRAWNVRSSLLLRLLICGSFPHQMFKRRLGRETAGWRWAALLTNRHRKRPFSDLSFRQQMLSHCQEPAYRQHFSPCEPADVLWPWSWQLWGQLPDPGVTAMWWYVPSPLPRILAVAGT